MRYKFDYTQSQVKGVNSIGGEKERNLFIQGVRSQKVIICACVRSYILCVRSLKLLSFFLMRIWDCSRFPSFIYRKKQQQTLFFKFLSIWLLYDISMQPENRMLLYFFAYANIIIIISGSSSITICIAKVNYMLIFFPRFF